MSCGVLLAAVLAAAPMADAAPSSPAAAASAAPSSVAGEPLYRDIVGRARSLESIVRGWMAQPPADGAPARALPGFSAFKAEAEALAALDMKGHLDLKARDTDGDLKCILRGISEDMPKRIAAVEAASTAREQHLALDELAYLLNDNIGVITAPPKPPV